MTEILVASLVAPAVLASVGMLIRVMVRVERLATVVERELNPNAGSSLRDRVMRIELSLQALHHRHAYDTETPHGWDSPDGTPV